jgi:hypothetical protein
MKNTTLVIARQVERPSGMTRLRTEVIILKEEFTALGHDMSAISRTNTAGKTGFLELFHVRSCLVEMNMSYDVFFIQNSTAKFNEVVKEDAMHVAGDCS